MNKTISKNFPDSEICIIDQNGTELTTPTKGLAVNLHFKDNEETPYEAEVVGTGGHYAAIGLWWDNKELVDYDGVFELPKELATVLKENGFTLQDDCESDLV